MAGKRSVLAIFAHPDDIEFRAAGTLLKLSEAGYDVHCLNVSCGNCGSMTHDSDAITRMRWEEAQAAAGVLGARIYPSLARDLEITYRVDLLKKVAAVVREADPGIVLTHALEDYMEDHMITARLAVTAAFSKRMPNFTTDPNREAVDGDVTVYHALPHGLQNRLGQPAALPEAVVDTSGVHSKKREALAKHASQKDWLDETQGMGSYLVAMDNESEAVAAMTGNGFRYGEGWTRHGHLGFCEAAADPLAAALGDSYHFL